LDLEDDELEKQFIKAATHLQRLSKKKSKNEGNP
jgi:hypothetical protein